MQNTLSRNIKVSKYDNVSHYGQGWFKEFLVGVVDLEKLEKNLEKLEKKNLPRGFKSIKILESWKLTQSSSIVMLESKKFFP